jgi:hypothetical protein
MTLLNHQPRAITRSIAIGRTVLVRAILGITTAAFLGLLTVNLFPATAAAQTGPYQDRINGGQDIRIEFGPDRLDSISNVPFAGNRSPASRATGVRVPRRK